MKAVHFETAADLRNWLEKYHATAAELIVGLYKKASGRGGLTYADMVDELLCFGWIDGVKRRLDEDSYCHRITPRRPRSIWSQHNVGRVEHLKNAGRMHPAGLSAYAARHALRTGVYSFEKRPQQFPSSFAVIFRQRKAAWDFWQKQPPGYRRLTIHWVTGAKQAPTQIRRLEKLIAASAAGRRLFA